MSTTAEDTSSSSSSSSSSSPGGSGGVSGAGDRVEERFRVDRRKLESLMLTARQDGSQETRPLDQFFAEIERQTGAQIAWPSRLKIGAKSKRDPQVKISGPATAVQLAKALVLSQCSRKFSKLTLRIDVPHTEHGQLIGRQGSLQKEIKLRTGTDIHFPDSNKSASATVASAAADVSKSNQVSLNGLAGPQPAGMEAARRVIRAKQPVAVVIQLPLTPDPAGHAFVRQVCAAFDVSVGRHQPQQQAQQAVLGNIDEDSSGWTVRGVAENLEGLARAVEGLALYAGNLISLSGQATASVLPPLVRCRLDFERRHAAAVRERMQAELLALANPAGSSHSDANLFKAALKQFGVRRFELTDSGAVMWEAGGCRALLRLRQFVVDCLPVYLCFDMPCNSFAFEDSLVESLKGRTVEEVSVDFAIRRGNCGGARAVTLRTHEGNVHAMFRLLARLFATPVPEQPPLPIPVVPIVVHVPPTTPLPAQAAAAVHFTVPTSQSPASATVISPATPQMPAAQQHQDAAAAEAGPGGVPGNSAPSASLAPGAEYSRRKLAALRIMSQSRPSGDRFPTGHWSGMYFSRSWATPSGAEPEPPPVPHPHQASSPAQLLQQASRTHLHPSHHQSQAPPAVDTFAQSCHHQQLRVSTLTEDAADSTDSAGALLHLLSENNLADCAQAMLTNEIDLQTFLTLSDDDLKSLGLPYATREKIHRLIHSIASGPLV